MTITAERSSPASGPAARRARRPWLVAVVCAIVATGLAVTLIAFHLPSRHDRQHATAAGALTNTEQLATQAAAQEVVDLLTYTRASFNADFQRALNGMSGALQSDQAKDKAATLAAMTKGKFDLKGQVTQTALESSTPTTALVLVSATGYQVPASGTPTPTTYARFEVTMTEVKGTWLATNLSSVGLT
jgi:hypothetical protein